ncbi:MAG: HAD family hydrolase [Planctomycetota bacterium]
MINKLLSRYSVDAETGDSLLAPDSEAGDIVDGANSPIKISLISLHGLVRVNDMELGRDADTGGQVKYVVELASELAKLPNVREVELLTRQVIDPKVDDSYAQLYEEISPKAKLIRIPFGPKRYLRKEALWPYLEMFVDQTLQHWRRNGLPDVIHGHYADAGLAGAQLARLLHLPFVFTGHSLGRVKKQRLAAKTKDPAKRKANDEKYRFAMRIEAEEMALETASMVVTSTYQEIEQQYELYDHYQPQRMEVIPPGVDLGAFSPEPKVGSDEDSQIASDIQRFLVDPNKPIILAVARPDERKNLTALVEVYGESKRLQELANLVLVMGSRDDLKQLPKPQQRVINDVIYLIDRYDLYGKVAYPKAHLSDDIPRLYRIAAASKGVFINPALTEPFGLTLLEAAGVGLPVIATNDGGPRDILGNCKNGLLIDPLDQNDIENKLIRSLSDDEQWESWSNNGLNNTRKYYSWLNHAKTYTRDLFELMDSEKIPAAVNRPSRRLPEFDRLIITDLDNTLTGDAESLEQFKQLIIENDHIGFGIATGRRLEKAIEIITELDLPKPDLIDTDAGTQLHYGDSLTADLSWRKSISFAWRPDEIRKILEPLEGVELQADVEQSEFKIGYKLDENSKTSVSKIKRMLRAAGLRAKVVMSLGCFIDIIPVRGGSDLSLRHVLWKWGFTPENVLVAGDSGNDAGMLLGRTLGVVVANHGPEMKRLRNRPRVFFSERSHAAGILEGIDYYKFLGDIHIPNDRIE